MIILPAIDLIGGKCVRLTKGEFGTEERVAADYLETALQFKSAGAEYLHMVDLDGARSGKPENSDVILDTLANTKLKIEVGGGVRSLDTVEMYLSRGIDRVILGSVAVKDPQLVRVAAKEFGDRIAVGIDAKGGFVATEGWEEDSGVQFDTLALKMFDAGVKHFIFTDIERDGTLEGVNINHTRQLHDKISVKGGTVTASGGVRDITDIKALVGIGVYGAICGKAIYKGKLDLKEAIGVAAGEYA
ncbi:MAG: 1-(5-phosphoribosyl)-5-[(5-phosphoribosylamino)methylideneamino]imidazole-4-carboxamide isomerase [Oscillospiraceae bacterium]|jgi:phosphoribosylformimino-5-aminoimidazole carboxamide ribotide isomerase|nr:1-(5-phosphoribosyl)-5-[(5-phosphoribosylamino)methylideneamino]imidazole-4-carboxamide isomerase [Oscillospiraceae bacterium]